MTETASLRAVNRAAVGSVVRCRHLTKPGVRQSRYGRMSLGEMRRPVEVTTSLVFFGRGARNGFKSVTTILVRLFFGPAIGVILLIVPRYKSSQILYAAANTMRRLRPVSFASARSSAALTQRAPSLNSPVPPFLWISLSRLE